MHYVKHFDILGIKTAQIPCVELQGAPNSATEGAVGLLGMNILSDDKELYICTAVNGSVYTWKSLKDGKDGVSIIKTEINDNCELIITFSNGTQTNLGVIKGEKGEKGEQADLSKIKEINNGNEIEIWVGTEEEYSNLPTKKQDTLYIFATDFEQETKKSLEDIISGEQPVAKAVGLKRELIYEGAKPTDDTLHKLIKPNTPYVLEIVYKGNYKYTKILKGLFSQVEDRYGFSKIDTTHSTYTEHISHEYSYMIKKNGDTAWFNNFLIMYEMAPDYSADNIAYIQTRKKRQDVATVESIKVYEYYDTSVLA